MIKVIDTGHGYTKDSQGDVFESKVSENATDILKNLDSFKLTLELGSLMTFLVGSAATGRMFDLDKVNNEVTKILVYGSLCRTIPQEKAEIQLVIGTPIEQYKQQRNKLETYLTTLAYWNATYNAMSKPKVIIGPSGGGKSKYVANYVSYAANAGYGNIVFDYIKRCELSDDISSKIKDKNNIVNIDLSDLRDMSSLTYCELQYSEDLMERFKIAFSIKEIVRELVENIQSDSTLVMSSKMLKYLSAACLVVFIHPNESIFTVYQVLDDPKVRHTYIRKALEAELFTHESTEIMDLYALDMEDKKTGELSTSEKKTEGIMDRLSVLVNGLHTRYMLASTKHINFVELMEQHKTVLIRMPQDEFVSKAEKDIIVSCLLTKVWLAQQIRGKIHEKPDICNIVIDEIHQVKGSAKAIANIIPEVRKFGGSFVFAAQYFSQFGVLQAALSGTGSSYMPIAGSDKDILKTMKEEMAPFTIEEALKLPKFHSLNIIDNENERCVFVSKMPYKN